MYDRFEGRTILVEMTAVPMTYVGRLVEESDGLLLLSDVTKTSYDADGSVRRESRPEAILDTGDLTAVELMPDEPQRSDEPSLMYGDYAG